MIWFFIAVLGAMASLGVAAWARAQQRKVKAEEAARRENARLQRQEAELLARLRDKQS